MCRVWCIVSKIFIVVLLFESFSPIATHSRSPLQQVTDRSAHLPALSLRRLQRCAGVRGSICSSYYAQSLQQLHQPRIFDKPCPINAQLNTPCGLGVCHGDTGLCDCPAGTQDDTSTPAQPLLWFVQCRKYCFLLQHSTCSTEGTSCTCIIYCIDQATMSAHAVHL
jgi:hypothetical protein